METKHTFCRICEALCGLEVDVEDGQVAAIRPDDAHVATAGFACIKGLRQHEIFSSPDRLKYPLKRVAGRLERVSWEQAISEIGEKVRAISGAGGPDSIAMYVGTAAGFGVLHPIFAQGFMTGVGSKSMFSSATQDCANKFAVARHMYGFPFTQPFPDVDRTQCLIVVGANPAVSKWSFLHVANPIARLKALCARGGKLYFVDPRRTESAKVAGEHVFIRPGGDVFFYLSFLRELIAIGGVNEERVLRHMRGYDRIAELCAPWTAERAAEVTRIAPEKLREMVAAYAAADGAALYCSTGVNMGRHGTMSFWLQEVINAVSGNLDRRGGTLVGRGVIDFPKLAHKGGVLMRDERSRVGGIPMVNDTFAGGLLGDEILTPGKGQIRGLFVTGGNPLLTMADGHKLARAFADLELLVALDILPGETAQASHYVLPCTSPLERPDLPFIFPLMLGLQSKPYLQATEAIVEADGEQRDEATIYLDLARASGAPLFGSWAIQTLLEAARAGHGWARRLRGKNGQPAVPQAGMLSLLLRACGQPSFDALLSHVHGTLREDHRENDFLGARVLTEDGLLHLAPEPLMRQSAELEAAFEQERRDGRRLKLITKRAVTSHNSWTHNHERMIERGTNFLYMHPDDAERAGLGDGEMADVRSDTGAVRVPIRVLAELMPGTVALPHGWGHQRSGLSVAKRTRGVNVNLLAASGPERVDPVSGMSQLTGIVVDVSRAADPQAHDWSGMAPPGH